jgi:hypothetical protein
MSFVLTVMSITVVGSVLVFWQGLQCHGRVLLVDDARGEAAVAAITDTMDFMVVVLLSDSHTAWLS